MRLIDADALWMVTEGDHQYYEKFEIENAPTVDPFKHGHWDCKGFEPVRCSVCGITVDAINGIPWAIKSFNYCPHCGAKMDEVREDADT